jgi:hypothetical protein
MIRLFIAPPRDFLKPFVPRYLRSKGSAGFGDVVPAGVRRVDPNAHEPCGRGVTEAFESGEPARLSCGVLAMASAIRASTGRVPGDGGQAFEGGGRLLDGLRCHREAETLVELFDVEAAGDVVCAENRDDAVPITVAGWGGHDSARALKPYSGSVGDDLGELRADLR